MGELDKEGFAKLEEDVAEKKEEQRQLMVRLYPTECREES